MLISFVLLLLAGVLCCRLYLDFDVGCGTSDRDDEGDAERKRFYQRLDEEILLDFDEVTRDK